MNMHNILLVYSVSHEEEEPQRCMIPLISSSKCSLITDGTQRRVCDDKRTNTGIKSAQMQVATRGKHKRTQTRKKIHRTGL